jgi:hypothetical protein
MVLSCACCREAVTGESQRRSARDAAFLQQHPQFGGDDVWHRNAGTYMNVCIVMEGP